MAVWNSIVVSDLRGAFRLDPEFWRPEYIQAEMDASSRPHDSLGQVALSLRKGVFNILADSYVDAGIPFYRSSNVGHIIPREGGLAYITAERNALELKTSLRRGDIFLSKTGREGASVVLDEVCNVSQDVIALKPDRGAVNPFFLAVYLNTRFGLSQLRRWFQGQVQFHLSLPDARQILIPRVGSDFALQIENLVHSGERWQKEAEQALLAAETELVAALHLPENASSQKSYIADLATLSSERRFDAEYSHPRLQENLRALRRDGLVLADVASLAEETFDPARHRGHFSYIEIGSLDRYGRAQPSQLSVEEAPSRATWKVRSGDVITSMVRPLRRLSALITEIEDGSVCSSGFAVLKPKPTLLAEVLLTYLRLPSVCEILDLYSTASMYPAVPVKRLMQLPIVKLHDDVQSKVAAWVRKSLFAREQCDAELRRAVTSVEQELRMT